MSRYPGGNTILLIGVLAGCCWAGITSAAEVQPPAASTRPPSIMDEIRRDDEASRRRRAEFQSEVAAIDRMLDNMKRLSFEIELRLAKIRAGDYERDCSMVDAELQAVGEALVTVEKMKTEADRMCASVGVKSADAKTICAGRNADLEARAAGLREAKRLFVAACPDAAGKENR